ncbi:HAAS signaling domain-containing protein [Pueribacillus sp. YX66]|uniref:HAAS signaling domain-containing protein n=1 Tax=Pueribacillus sp. YX66 TaxID=3229242 RepID=UPI00358D3E39
MTKAEFLQALERELQKLKDYEREEILYDFEEHFAAGLAEGKREDEIASDLGDPKIIAKELLVDYRVTQAETEKSVKNIFQAMIATISLSFFNLIFVLGPAAAVIGVYIGLGVTAITLVLSPLGWFISFLFGFGQVNMLQSFFASVLFCGIGLLLSVGVYYFGKFLYDLLLKYIKFNLRIVKGEK